MRDGRIRIATEQAAGRISVVVEDFGGGIEPEHLHRIYDPFFTTKTKPRNGEHKGTGLGLAVSYGIMQEHGGKMQVESEVGVGTTFRLEFPLVPAKVVAGTQADGEGGAVREPRGAVHV
jgi:signal transduction histidine kinase